VTTHFFFLPQELFARYNNFLLATRFFFSLRFLFLLQEKIIVPRKNILALRKKNVLSLCQENIFLSSENVYVSILAMLNCVWIKGTPSIAVLQTLLPFLSSF